MYVPSEGSLVEKGRVELNWNWSCSFLSVKFYFSLYTSGEDKDLSAKGPASAGIYFLSSLKMQWFHSISLQHTAFVSFLGLFFFSSPLWFFCFLLACHNLPLTIWEASDPMRRVHWNILVLQECTHCKTVNCFSYSYTGSQKARLRVLSCWGSVWSLQAHGQNSERPSDTSTPGGIRERLQVTNISQGTGAIPPLPYPRDCWWQWGGHLDCPARTAVAKCGVGSCFKDMPSPLGYQTPGAKLREVSVRRHLGKFQKNTKLKGGQWR